jgi:succinoglycan biosynthesis transport protein ExoP
MPRYELELSDYERLFRRRYKFVIAITIIVTGFAILFAKIKPVQFKTSTLISVDRSAVWSPDEKGDDAAIYGEWDNIATQVREMTGYSVLVRAAKKCNLVSDSVAEDILIADETVRKMLDGLAARIEVTAQSAVNTIQITATSSDAAEAQRLANAVAAAYKEFAFYQKKLHVARTGMIIRQQLEQCDTALHAIEAAMVQFEREEKAPTEEMQLNLMMDRQSNLAIALKELRIESASIALQKENLLQRRAAKNPPESDRRAGPSIDGLGNPAGRQRSGIDRACQPADRAAARSRKPARALHPQPPIRAGDGSLDR